jgi:GAF domain-containing protein
LRRLGQPTAVFDATKDEQIQYRENAKKEGIASMLSVPMLLREEIIGVIRVYTAEPYDFTLDDMYFVGAVANLGAIALGNAKLY